MRDRVFARSKRGQGGFTLVEALIAIVALGAIGAVVGVFIRPAIDGYFAQRARTEINQVAGSALRMMASDVRLSVPNSIRTPSSSCFETVPTLAGGAYRVSRDLVNDSSGSCAPSGSCSAPVDPSRPVSQFDVLTALPSTVGVGDWVVFGDQVTGEIYSGASSSAIAQLQTPRTSDGKHRIVLDATDPISLSPGSDSGRFLVVSNQQKAVFYVCSGADGTLDANGNGKGSLWRLQNYGFNTTYPAACPAVSGGDLVASGIRRCSFTYSPGSGGTQQNGIVRFELEVTRNSESATLVQSAHIDNAP